MFKLMRMDNKLKITDLKARVIYASRGHGMCISDHGCVAGAAPRWVFVLSGEHVVGVQVDHMAVESKATLKKLEGQLTQLESDIASMQGVIEKGTKVERHILAGKDVRELAF
eukprot:7529957-Pyramimonas_sp.AAC.1